MLRESFLLTWENVLKKMRQNVTSVFEVAKVSYFWKESYMMIPFLGLVKWIEPDIISQKVEPWERPFNAAFYWHQLSNKALTKFLRELYQGLSARYLKELKKNDPEKWDGAMPAASQMVEYYFGIQSVNKKRGRRK